MGGLLGLLAVLAFVILAAVIVTRRGPDRTAEVPPSPAPPPATTLALPSDAPPATDASPAIEASPEPEASPDAAASPAANR